MSLEEFELTIPAFERAMAVHALYRAATMIGVRYIKWMQNIELLMSFFSPCDVSYSDVMASVAWIKRTYKEWHAMGEMFAQPHRI
jgi:hypothetical protein